MKATTLLLSAGSGLLVCALLAVSCGKAGQAPAAGSTPAFLDVVTSAKPAASEATLARGRELFAYNCAHCHGERGEGDGYGAPFLVPQPRNFVTAKYKFRTTASGELPTDEDLFRTDLARRDGHGNAALAVLAERRRSVGARRLREDVFTVVCRGSRTEADESCTASRGPAGRGQRP
jgi:cytochrome c553